MSQRRAVYKMPYKEVHSELIRIIDNLDAIVYVADMETYELLYVNRFVRNTFGDITGKICWKSFQSGQSSPCEFCTNEKLLDKKGSPLEEVYRWEFKNTVNSHWYDIRDKAIEWVDGRIVRLEIATDITERKKSEEEIKLKEIQLLKAQKIAKLGFWDLDLITGELYWSDEIYGMLGFKPNEIVPNYEVFKDRLHPEDRDYAQEHVDAALNDNIPYNIDFRYLFPTGEICYANAQGEVIRDETGKAIRFFGTQQDITERKKAEDDLRESEEKFKTLVENSPMALSIVNIDGTIEFINSKHIMLTGFTPDDIPNLEQWWSKVYPDDDVRRRVADSWYRFIASDSTGEDMGIVERQIVCKDGDVKNIELSFTRNKDKIIVAFNDITNRKIIEEQQIKVQKNDAIEKLSGGLAHDFNNLLQGIFGYISLAKTTLDDREVTRKTLEEAEKALELSINLTNQLLSFSRGANTTKQIVSLHPLIEDSIRFALSGSNVSHTLDISSDLCDVEADKGQITQVIQNIIINAREAMSNGGNVDVEARNVVFSKDMEHPILDNGKYVAISINDKGDGIPDENISKIFDPYFTTKEKGNGLGLATSYSIVRNHQGIIDVGSSINKGSTFTIYLPSTGSSSGAVMQSPEEGFSLNPLRVLVMDDEEVVRNVSTLMLTELGHKVDTVEHGEDAIEAYRSKHESGEQYEIVILDLTIRGGMGGEETFLELRKINPDVKVIFSSGYYNKEIEIQQEQDKFVVFLTKPYKIDDLNQCLAKLLNA
jgi:PAS domain S-box-containing protein